MKRPLFTIRSAPGLFWTVLAAAFSIGSPSGPRVEDLESQIKVEFMQRFTDYVEWPADAFESKTSAFNVCAVGDGPLKPRIGAILGKSRIKDRPVKVRTLKVGEDPAGCHMLYIAPSEADQVDRIVKQVGKAPVLTIGDAPGFARHGVFINLFLEATHVRFVINAPAAKANGLTVSVKLLVLARPAESGG